MARSFDIALRHNGTASLPVGSAAGASTAVFGAQTFTIRVASDTAVRYVVGDSPSVNSTTIAQTGALLPANTVELVSVAPGQRISFVAPSTSTANVTVTEAW